MSVPIKNGHIFTAVDNYLADILVDEGKIRTIGMDLTADAEKTIDATGKYVIPGGVDPHTHLDFPFGGTVSSDDFSIGTIAAAGGTTSIVDFVVQHRGQSLTEALEIWHRKAEGQAAIDYGFHMIVQDLPDHRLSEMDEMVRQGVTRFKMFMACCNARVHRFSAPGELISSWGEPGKSGPNEFHLPHSLMVGQDSRIYLCDRENSRIQVFSQEGEYITMWTDMNRPSDISQDSEGIFYISERAENGTPPQISVLDGEGNVLARWPSRSAHGSWVDAHGDIYLALTAEQSVDKYIRQG